MTTTITLATLAVTLILLRKAHIMATAFERLRAEVEEQNDINQSAITLITSLAEQIRNSIGNEDELNALADRLDAQSNTLADAVRANTPADPEGETEE